MPNSTRLTAGLRLFCIYFAAVSVSLPMAWISLGKLLLFASALVYFSAQLLTQKNDAALRRLWSVKVVLLIVAVFAFSLLWTEAPTDIALLAFAKHSKLLEIALLVSLIRNAREARFALLAFSLGQTSFILSSWVMATGYRVPWATSEAHPDYTYVVYSTYLDQTLIFAGAAAVFWHLRQQLLLLPWLALLMALLAVGNNLFLQVGKTGYLATLAVFALAVAWEIPKKWRLTMLVLVPLVAGAGLYAGSAKFQGKVSQVVAESQGYANAGDSATSSGLRLHAWKRSLQAMAQQPLTGHGVGSWTQSVKRIEGADAQKVFRNGLTSNPHQEFLLWGVELGVGGTLLLLALIASLTRDALTFSTPVMRATLSMVALMVVACLFNCSLYDALIGDFFCVTLGLLLALGSREPNPGSPALPEATVKFAT